jgi:hypothetical protein
MVLGLPAAGAKGLPALEGLRWFLAGLFLVLNVAYISLAIGIRVKLPARVLGRLIVGVAAALLPLWLKDHVKA